MICDIIENTYYPADKAVYQIIEEKAREMEELDNPYMQERSTDIRDIGKRLLYAIKGIEVSTLENLPDSSIVIAYDLSPSDTAQMDRSKILGFATVTGGITSHVAIMAKSMEIPAIVGMGEMPAGIRDGMTLVLDASMGKIILNPTEKTLEEYKKKIHAIEISKAELAKLKDLPAKTIDSHRVELCANIGSTNDVENALKHGAEGIGLYRTEFLYMDKPEMPSEQEQFEAYRVVAQHMGNKSIIIRTMDIGGDKELDYLDFPDEQNPFLGWRAIRMCLDAPEIITVQLRAILRASHYGKLRIMYPMIISIEEIAKLNTILDSAKTQLRNEEIPFDENIEVGIMIETPAAAVIADKLIEHVDFFSIGTNDLTQYTLAVDRGNEKIAHLYQPLHPAVLNLIKNVIDASHRAGKWTGICGELAGNEKAAPLLVGMGVDELSMSASSIGKIKSLIRRSKQSELEILAAEILKQSVTVDILTLLDRYVIGLDQT